MIVDLTKRDLYALISCTYPAYGGCELSKFNGNQWNENWCWDFSKFENFTDEQLWNFYLEKKRKPEEQKKVEEPKETFVWPHHQTYK